jgi:hypothetical protein
MRAFFALATAVVTIAAPASAATNLIGNGGFETPALGGAVYGQYFGGQAIGAWTVTGADVLTVESGYAEPGISFTAGEGQQSLDITGAGNTSPADGVYQDVATVAGQKYTLKFLLGNADGSQNPVYTLPSSIGVSIDGGAVTNYTNAAVTPLGINWATKYYSFTATGATTRVAFSNTTPSSPVTDNFAGLDAVSLSVPEPASWALMLSGFGLVGATVRRRRGNIVFA